MKINRPLKPVFQRSHAPADLGVLNTRSQKRSHNALPLQSVLNSACAQRRARLGSTQRAQPEVFRRTNNTRSQKRSYNALPL